MKPVHIVCTACRIEKRVTGLNSADSRKIESGHCCKCGYKTIYAITVKVATEDFYCQVNRVHDVPR